MNWDYYDDPRLDVQAVIAAAGRRFLDVGCAGAALAVALKKSGAAYVAGIEEHPRCESNAWNVTTD